MQSPFGAFASSSPESDPPTGFLFGKPGRPAPVRKSPFCSTPPPPDLPKPTPAPSLPADVAALHAIINSLQAELQASASVNTHLAASVARQLQAEQLQAPLTPASTDPTPNSTTAATPSHNTHAQ